MPVLLNHTIVHCRDKRASALFLSEVLGLPAPTRFGPFSVVQVANDVSLDFLEEGTVHPQHYAFLVDEDEFDQIHGRILARGISYWADPGLSRPQQINTNDGGRGLYWLDPDGHVLEILTVPYGGWPEPAGSQSFRDRDTERLAQRERVTNWSPELQKAALRKLRMLDAAEEVMERRGLGCAAAVVLACGVSTCVDAREARC